MGYGNKYFCFMNLKERRDSVQNLFQTFPGCLNIVMTSRISDDGYERWRNA